jgi:hypothetical protein
MHLTPNRPHRIRLFQIMLFVIAVAMTCVGIAGLASQAKAAPVQFRFDNGQVLMGVFEREKILPASAQFPSDSLPLPQLTTSIDLIGDETNGNLTVSAALNNNGTRIPYMNLPHPLEEGLLIPFTFRLNDPGLSGTYDAATGAATLSGSMDIVIVTGLGTNPLPSVPPDLGVPPLSTFARCRLANVPVNFQTDVKEPFTGERFSGGVGVKGAMVTDWERLPEAVSENGGDCSLIPVATAGPGGLWLSNGIAEPIPQEMVPPTCDIDASYCPPTAVRISKAKLTPKKRSVRPGKKVRLKLAVTNRGDEDARGLTVRIKSSNKRVKVPRKVVLDVDAGSTAKKTITVRVKRRARGKAKITVTADGKKGNARLKIKKPKRRR